MCAVGAEWRGLGCWVSWCEIYGVGEVGELVMGNIALKKRARGGV